MNAASFWERFRDRVMARVEALEGAAFALLAGALEPAARRDAEREAHRLVGVGGTIGFPHASEIARQVEALLRGTEPLQPAEVLRLSELVVALRAEFERGPTASLAGEPLPAAAAEPGETRPPLLLLVVAEEAGAAERYQLEAEARGFGTRLVARAAEVLPALAATPADAVLLDLADGQVDDALRLVEVLSEQVPPLPVFVVAFHASFMDRVLVARRGARGFLQKPVAPATVVEAIRSLLHRQGEGSSRVLAVDDDPEMLERIRTLLVPRGIDVTTLDNPLFFWERLFEVTPDLLVLDVDMPQLSGLELCRVVRNDPRWGVLPVLFLTAQTDAALVNRLFAAGADDFVSKPVVGPELVARIENRLERTRLHRQRAETDETTGIANRRKGVEVLERFLRMAQRHGQPLSVALLDLDHFKEINDQHGHAVGDRVLRRAAELLARGFRSEDVVARWGGEEFVVGMYGTHRAQAAARLAQLLDALRQEPFHAPDGAAIRVTASAGVAQYPDDGGDLPALERQADTALYAAKHAGRDRVLQAGAHEGAPAATAATEAVDVAVVEDDRVVAHLLTHSLSTQGLRTRWFADGEAALEALGGADPALTARLVLLDVSLPGVDGLSVLRRLAQQGVTSRTRVVMLTARAVEAEMVQALEMGASDYVTKPFSVPVLLQRVRRALEGAAPGG